MDPQERDASKLRRQESLAQRLGEALDRITPHDARQCPDPEIIAAYAEQTLDPAETAEWEGHFAACARCRNILRVLAASADTPLADKEVAQIGELVAAAAARPALQMPTVSAAQARPKVVRWPTRWLAPAIGVAAVLAVWFAMRPPWRSVDQGGSGTLVAQAPREEMQTPPATPPVPEETEKVAPQAEQKTEPAAPVDRSRAAAVPQNAPAEIAPQREAGKGSDAFSPSAGAATGALQDEKKLDRFAEGRQNQTTAVAPAPPSPPPARLAMPAPAAPQAEAKAASGAVTGGLPPATASANAVENEPASRDKQADAIQAQQGTASTMAQAEITPQASARKQQAFGVARSLQPNSSLMKAPSDLVHWRAGKGGVIQRSVDAGRTWTGQTSPSKEDWLAGAAFSDTVCWLAGRHGAIARTTDGQTWQTILPPVQAAGAGGNWPDWTGITASDAQTAVVTASDGRKFGTTDGGKTWQPQ